MACTHAWLMQRNQTSYSPANAVNSRAKVKLLLGHKIISVKVGKASLRSYYLPAQWGMVFTGPTAIGWAPGELEPESHLGDNLVLLLKIIP